MKFNPISWAGRLYQGAIARTKAYQDLKVELGVREEQIVASKVELGVREEQIGVLEMRVLKQIGANRSLREQRAYLSTRYAEEVKGRNQIIAGEVSKHGAVIDEEGAKAKQAFNDSLRTIGDGYAVFMREGAQEIAVAVEKAKEAEKQAKCARKFLRASDERISELESGRAIVPFFKFMETDSRFGDVSGIFFDYTHEPVYATPRVFKDFDTSEDELFSFDSPISILRVGELLSGKACLKFGRDDMYKVELTPHKIVAKDGRLIGTFLALGEIEHSPMEKLRTRKEDRAVINLLSLIFGHQKDVSFA